MCLKVLNSEKYWFAYFGLPHSGYHHSNSLKGLFFAMDCGYWNNNNLNINN